MYTRVLLAAFVIGGHSIAAAQVHEFPIAFSSLGETWASKGYFQGRVALHSDSIVIVFDSVYVEVTSEEPPLSLYHLDSMTVDLAGPANGSGWQIYAKGPTWVIADTLAERSTFSMGDLRSAIARPADDLLAESWIVVTFYQIVAPRLVPREQQAPGTTYAHSPRALFASAKR
jgi:hypothetical protein